MEIYIKQLFRESPEYTVQDELHDKLGKTGYCLTESGCVDDHFFTTKKELFNAAKEYKNPILSRLVWNSEIEEYDCLDI